MIQAAERTVLKPVTPEQDVPVGNAPPTSPWLLVLAAAAWIGGITFLIIMASWRLQTS